MASLNDSIREVFLKDESRKMIHKIIDVNELVDSYGLTAPEVGISDQTVHGRPQLVFEIGFGSGIARIDPQELRKYGLEPPSIHNSLHTHPDIVDNTNKLSQFMSGEDLIFSRNRNIGECMVYRENVNNTLIYNLKCVHPKILSLQDKDMQEYIEVFRELDTKIVSNRSEESILNSFTTMEEYDQKMAELRTKFTKESQDKAINNAIIRLNDIEKRLDITPIPITTRPIPKKKSIYPILSIHLDQGYDSFDPKSKSKLKQICEYSLAPYELGHIRLEEALNERVNPTTIQRIMDGKREDRYCKGNSEKKSIADLKQDLILCVQDNKNTRDTTCMNYWGRPNDLKLRTHSTFDINKTIRLK